MFEALDMSLDDIINKAKTKKLKIPHKNTHFSPPSPPVSGHRRRRGSTRRHLDHRSTRTTPYASPNGFPKLASVMSHYKPVEPEAEGNLYLSNLRFTVSNSDIQMLFSEVGEVKRCGVHYDGDGRSQGTAEVVFARKSDAIAAIKRFNNSPLDGLRLTIELIGPEATYPPMLPTVSDLQVASPIPRTIELIGQESTYPPMLPRVTDWQVAPPIPPTLAPWQMAPLTPHTVPPQWQMPLMSQTVPQWLRPGFKETPNHSFCDREWHHEGRYQGFDQKQIPQHKRLGKVSTKDLDADLEKYLSKRKIKFFV